MKDGSSSVGNLLSADDATGTGNNQIINGKLIDPVHEQLSNSVNQSTNQNVSEFEGASLTSLTENKPPNGESHASNETAPISTPAAIPPSEQHSKADPSDICGLCNSVLSAPRILSCFHVFDLHCLVARFTSPSNSTTQSSGSEGASGSLNDTHLQCPVASCRVSTPLVPPGLSGLASLPTDYALLLQLIAKAARPETRNVYRLKCSVCVANEPACSLCIDCPALLCPKALDSHKLLFSFLTHRVLSFEELLSASAASTAAGGPSDKSGASLNRLPATAASAPSPSQSAASDETAASSESKRSSIAVGFAIPVICKSHQSPVDRFCFHCQVRTVQYVSYYSLYLLYASVFSRDVS